MVLCFHKRNVYIKKLPRFMGGSLRPGMEICEISGLQIPKVPDLHQSNGYIKRKVQVWRAQKLITVLGAETVLTTVGPQTTPFHWWQYRAENANMRNFGPTNSHGTTFPQGKCLYQMEATGMEKSKRYCPSWCRNSTYQCGAANYPI